MVFKNNMAKVDKHTTSSHQTIPAMADLGVSVHPDQKSRLDALIHAAQTGQYPIELLAIVCPLIVDVPTMIPYSSGIDFTTVSVPGQHTERIKYAVATIQETIAIFASLGVQTRTHLCVSNIQPLMYKLRELLSGEFDFLKKTKIKFSKKFTAYLHEVLGSKTIRPDCDEICQVTQLHAQRIAGQIDPQHQVIIHDHLDILVKALSDQEPLSITEKLLIVLSGMNTLDINWQTPDAFLKALYTLDLTVLPTTLSSSPMLWLNMQAHREMQTELIHEAVLENPNIQTLVITRNNI